MKPDPWIDRIEQVMRYYYDRNGLLKSKNDLANETKLSRRTINYVIDRLYAEGIINDDFTVLPSYRSLFYYEIQKIKDREEIEQREAAKAEYKRKLVSIYWGWLCDHAYMFEFHLHPQMITYNEKDYLVKHYKEWSNDIIEKLLIRAMDGYNQKAESDYIDIVSGMVLYKGSSFGPFSIQSLNAALIEAFKDSKA